MAGSPRCRCATGSRGRSRGSAKPSALPPARSSTVERTRHIGGGPPENGPWVAVAGTRPNYVKLAPLVRAAREAGRELLWIDAGQHTDHALRAGMLADLGMPPATRTLAAPPAGPGRVDALADLFEGVLAALAPSVVLALGDVDATVAAALGAHRLDLPLAHVEAGLRCGDATMPEELNRELVDALADRFYTTEPSAHGHLGREGVDTERYALEVGNVMADALLQMQGALDGMGAPAAAEGCPYVLVTLHRQANVDNLAVLDHWISALYETTRRGRLSVLFPVHPRTRKTLLTRRSVEHLRDIGIVVTDPMTYVAFLAALRDAEAVITDSGGVQVEAALLGTPCVIARNVTEHQLSLTHGGAVLAGVEAYCFEDHLRAAQRAAGELPERPRAWDGRAAERIVADLAAGFDRPERRRSPREA